MSVSIEDSLSTRPSTRVQTAIRPFPLLLAALLIGGVAPPLLAGDDDDIEVGIGSDSRAASGPDGASVIVFERDDADESGVFAARYDSSGQPTGAAFQVNVATLDDQDEPDVTVLPTGDFVVVWRADVGMASTVTLRRFDSAGTPLAGEARVDDGPGLAETPRVAADALGRFTVVWAEEGDLLHRRFDVDGSALGSELAFSRSGRAEDPALGVLPTGEQLAAWTDGGDVLARRFDPSGSASGRAFLVHPATFGERSEPTVTPTADGAFLVAYESEGQDGSGSGIFVRRVEETPVGEEFQVNAITDDEQSLPSLGTESNGQILVTWQSEGNLDGDSAGIFGSFLRPTGRPICPDLPINLRTAGAQRVSSVAGGNGQFVVTWQTEAAVPMPGQVPTVQARVVTAPLFADGFESGDFEAWAVP